MKIKKGDILIETGRGMHSSGKGKKILYSMKIWEMPDNYDGQGVGYNMDGTQYEWYWAGLSNSIKIDKRKIDKRLLFSFYHGMNEFDSTIESGTVEEILSKSNWGEKIITEKDVENFINLKKIKLKSKKDVIKNIELLRNSKNTPWSIIYDVLKIFKIKKAIAHNGEIGIAGFVDQSNYSYLLTIL